MRRINRMKKLMIERVEIYLSIRQKKIQYCKKIISNMLAQAFSFLAD